MFSRFGSKCLNVNVNVVQTGVGTFQLGGNSRPPRTSQLGEPCTIPAIFDHMCMVVLVNEVNLTVVFYSGLLRIGHFKNM